MQKEKKNKNFIHKPNYPGGSAALKKYIRENLKYPKEALDNKIEGTVSARYEISHLGKVTQVNIISSLGYGCDEEATRLIKGLKFEVSKNRKLRVKFHKNINIHFRLPKKKKQQVKYNYTSSAKEKSVNNTNSESYSYTITIKSK